MFEVGPPNSGGGGAGRKVRRSDQRFELAFQPGERPHDLPLEQAVLSGILMKNDIIPDVQSILTPSDFFLPAHHEIYDAILKLQFANTPADITTLAGYLRNHGKLDFIGGPVYLSEIAAVPSSSMHAVDYSKIVADLSKRRRLLQAIDDAKNTALMPGDTRTVSSEIEKIIFSATQNKSSSNMARVSDLLMDAMQDFENRANNQGVVNGVLTGLKDLDKTLYGLRPGQLIVLAARPGMGKTSLAVNFMYDITVKQGRNVLFFSLEMTRMEVLERLFAQASGVDSSKLRSGHLQAKDFSDLCFAAEKLESAQFYIDDRSILTPYDVLAQANRLRANLNIVKQGTKIDLIVVDYIQIMKSGSNYENRSIEVASITGGLKAIAKELGVPVVALSQLNREGAKRGGATESKKPQLSDLRDSGAIEADADVVMFIHREQGSESDSRAPAPAEIIVAKQRGGPTGTIPVVWLGHLTQFSDAIDASRLPDGIPDGPGEYIPGPEGY